MKITLIYNWKFNKDDILPRYLIDNGFQISIIENHNDGPKRHTKFCRMINFFECINMARTALKQSSEDDMIISMCTTPGIIASILGKKKKVKILSINLLCDFSSINIKNKLRNQLYKLAFKNELMFSTCNNITDVSNYYQHFKIGYSMHIFQLNDGIRFNTNSRFSINNRPMSIFSAGSSARDWYTLSEVAKKMKDYHFNVIAKKDDWKHDYDQVNISLNTNVPYETYISKLRNNDLVVLLLNSDVTSGLLVLFDAVNNGKIPLITETPSTKIFIPDNVKPILLLKMFDTEDIERKIRYINGLSYHEKKQIYEILKKYLYENFSEMNYCKNICNIIKKINEYCIH